MKIKVHKDPSYVIHLHQDSGGQETTAGKRPVILNAVRETIIWVLFIFFFGLACFQAGYILRDLRSDDAKDRIVKLERKFTDHDGRLVAVEAHTPRERK